MKRKVSWFRKLSFGCVLWLTAQAGSALAESMAYTGVGFNDANSGVTFGFEFTPDVDLTVTALGVLDGGVDGPGLQTDHMVGLWNAAGGAPLATVNVQIGSGVLQNGFRFAPLASSVALTAGQTYVLGAYYPSGFIGDKVGATSYYPYPLLTMPGTTLATGGGALAFPVPVPFTFFILAANMQFTPATTAIDYGDLNFDGSVNAADVMLGSRIMTGSLVPTPEQFVAADIAPYAGMPQPDNRITLGDLLLIQRIATGNLIP